MNIDLTTHEFCSYNCASLWKSKNIFLACHNVQDYIIEKWLWCLNSEAWNSLNGHNILNGVHVSVMKIVMPLCVVPTLSVQSRLDSRFVQQNTVQT